MFKHILIPTDGSELSQKTVQAGLKLAKSLLAKVTFMHVCGYQPVGVAPEKEHESGINDLQKLVNEAFQSKAERCLSQTEMAAKTAGVPCDYVLVKNTEIWKGILDTAKQKGCDVIMLSSHGQHGLTAVLLGSETIKVLTHSPIPVLVYR